MLQTGSTPITNGANTVAVTFPTAFDVTPPVLLTTVRNVSADAPKLVLESEVIEANRYGFTAGLGAETDTSNYVLDWLAGTAAQVLEVLAVYNGRKLSTYNALSSMLGQAFKLPVLVSQPRPGLKLIDQDTLFAALVQRAASVPASALAGGRDGLALAVDANWLYVGGAQGWGRLPVDFSTAWDANPFFVPFREGEAAITAVGGQIAYRIDFATPFAANPIPKVVPSVSDVSGGNKTVLSWQITDVDLAGFVITFSSPPETNNLKVYYMARQVDLS